MQNVAQGSSSDGQKVEKVSILDLGKSSTPHSSNSSPTKSETDTFSEHQPRFASDTSDSEEDDVSEAESFVIDQSDLDEEVRLEASKFLLAPEESEHAVDPETQARLEALLEAAGIGKLSAGDGKHLSDPEVLRRLTSSVSCALDEAAAALTRMRTENQRPQQETRSLVEACSDGDVGTVKKLLTEGRSVHETTEEGESLLSLACSAGYYELAQVLLAMHANVEDRGIKGDCTPLMEAASAGHVDIVRLLIAHGADVNAQSSSGNTPLMYGCAGGYSEVVKVMLEAGANVEDHNENGHTPLMEAASAGHVAVAKVLLEHGAGINTHSNEFKESALTLACYKGHLDMVRFLLEAGADQEHKTDEMHTALMEASMDGHVEVAKLLLDSGAQVNMPTDSFESPLTLAACGGHVDLAMLLIERGANIEEVNDEGYTPLMEAAREGHEEMVALLLSQGANINAQTEETQETALTLACCGGFLEVADFLLKAGADLELGSSTPLMEAAQEGHLELVRYLLDQSANVNAQTQTGDTALTYACENGHTDVADLLLQYGSDLEHESEGGRTPLMKACRAGHLCTVKFLIQKGADVNRQSTNNDHTPLSLASAGGHLTVVEHLLQHNADPFHKLKDNSTMLIEAAKGGHTSVVELLLDYPHSIMMGGQQQPPSGTASQPQTLVTAQTQTQTQPQTQPQQASTQTQRQTPPQTQPQPQPPSPITAVQHDQITLPLAKQIQQALIAVPEAIQALQEEVNPATVLNVDPIPKTNSESSVAPFVNLPEVSESKKSLLRKNRTNASAQDNALTLAEAQQAKNVPPGEGGAPLSKEDSNILDKGSTGDAAQAQQQQQQLLLQQQQLQQQRQQIYAELQRVEEEQEKHLRLAGSSAGKVEGAESATPAAVVTSPAPTPASGPLFPPGSPGLQNTLFTRKGTAAQSALSTNISTTTSTSTRQEVPGDSQSPTSAPAPAPAALYLPPPPSTPPQTISSSAEVSQSTAISDRPKAKPATKKESKNARKQQIVQAVTQELAFQAAQMAQAAHAQTGQLARQQRICAATAAAAANLANNLQISNQQLEQQVLQHHQQHHLHHPTQTEEQIAVGGGTGAGAAAPAVAGAVGAGGGGSVLTPSQLIAHLQQLDPSISAATPQQVPHHVHQVLHQKPSLRTLQQMLPGGPDAVELAELLSDHQKVELIAAAAAAEVDASLVDREHLASAVVDSLEALEALGLEENGGIQPFGTNATLEEAITAMAAAHVQGDMSRVEYYAVPTSAAQHPALQQLQYQQYQLTTAGTLPPGSLEVITNASNSQVLANRAVATAGTTTTTTTIASPFQPQLLLQSPQLTPLPSDSSTPSPPCSDAASPSLVPVPVPTPTIVPCPSHAPTPSVPPAPAPVLTSTCSPQSTATTTVTTAAQTSCLSSQPVHHHGTSCSSHQVQASTQTTSSGVSAPLAGDKKVTNVSQTVPAKGKKARYQVQSRQQQTGQEQTQSQQQQAAPSQQQGVTQHDAGTAAGQFPAQCGRAPASSLNVDSETESNHDTALTLACAGGHDTLVELLLNRGSDIEHRDKKGFTPLILAATAGHHKVVEILLKHCADIEAQSERTKDTPLSLACSGGRYEVVDLLLSKGANKEHRNVSDYTPLSLAASGGYVNIIKLLLAHGAEINSRTGSKLGISPLMLAAMNGHTAAVKLLLDMGSDINAQIETNRNTALTLACFQGRHEVVSLLLDRKANVEHRAKTGLTPLMEAASGGYVEVGRVLLDKGADVNAPPVPSSRDTGLTIAADKGHCRFVELLLSKGAQVEVKNKKGNSPLWLAANGGHLNVVELLYNAGADIDSQDNRKVSCLMAAFRKGHIKVVKWMVHHVTQFPSDQDMTRYVATINDKELLEKCQDCVKIIRAAKDQQAAKANKNASILLEELDMEKSREEGKRLAAQRRRERKKKKKQEKRRQLGNNNENEDDDNDIEDKGEESEREFSGSEANGVAPESVSPERVVVEADKEEGDSGIDANSQGSCSSSDVKAKDRRKEKKKKTATRNATSNNKAEKENNPPENVVTNNRISQNPNPNSRIPEERTTERRAAAIPSSATISTPTSSSSSTRSSVHERQERKVKIESKSVQPTTNHMVFEASSRHPAEREDFEATGNETYMPASKAKRASQLYNCGDVGRFDSETSSVSKSSSSTSPKQGGKREEGWKEVVRKSKKVSVPLNAISRVIGRGGSNINAIRTATGAQIEVEKQCKGQGERIITIKGSADATRQAHLLIAALIKDPDVDLMGMLPKPVKPTPSALGQWEKPTSTVVKVKTSAPPVGIKAVTVTSTATSLLGAAPCLTKLVPSSTGAGTGVGIGVGIGTGAGAGSVVAAGAVRLLSYSPPVTRGTAPRLVAAAEKRAAILAASGTKTTMSYTSAIMTSGRNAAKTNPPIVGQTFAAKLSEPMGIPNPSTSAAIAGAGAGAVKNRLPVATAPVTPLVSTVPSPKHHRPPPIASAPPSLPAHFKVHPQVSSAHVVPASAASLAISTRSSSPAQLQGETDTATSTTATPLTYSLFNSDKTMWSRDNDGNTNQKGMNFASVAAAGSASANTVQPPTTQYMDTTPPQVDISKAPGYRKNTMCSPISSKPCSNTSSPPSIGSVEHSASSPVKAPQLLTLNRPTNVDVTQAPPSQTQSAQPSPILRANLEIQAPEMGLTVNRTLDMQHSPSGLAVQRPNKEGPPPPPQQQQPPPQPLASPQPNPPQPQNPIGSGLAVQRPSMVEMQHSPNRGPQPVEMQASPQGQQGPPPQPQHQPPHQPHPSHHSIQRPMSMEIPPAAPLNHNMVLRPNSMVDGMSVPRPLDLPPPSQQQSQSQQQQQHQQQHQHQHQHQQHQQQSQQQQQPPPQPQQQRIDMPPTDFRPVFEGSHDSGLFNPQETLLGMVPGMTETLLNTAVSMSRLNPRAPDFSSSLHHTSKPPPHQPQPPHPPMFQSAPPYLAPTMLPPMPNKFHPPRPSGPPGPGNSHNRWPFMPHGYQPDTNNFNVLAAGLAASLNHPSEMMPMSENGNSPPSPNHGPGTGPHGDAPMKAPPRPIGTERHAFKHHSMGGDADWLLNMQQPPPTDHKMPWAGPQIFRSNPPPFDLPPMDTSFPLGMENQFHNGGNAAAVALSALHHTIPMMNPYNAGAAAGSFGTDLSGHDAMKMDAQSWEGANRLGMLDHSDKQHGWTKWSH